MNDYGLGELHQKILEMAIYIDELCKENNFARVSDIALKLNVSKASTNSAVQTLQNKGLVKTEKYREIYLTEEGAKLASMTARKHKTIKDFLITVLGVEPVIADTDVCAIEHVISQDSVQAMKDYMKSKH